MIVSKGPAGSLHPLYRQLVHVSGRFYLKSEEQAASLILTFLRHSSH